MEPIARPPNPGMTLTKAIMRASTWLGMTGFALAQVFGGKEPTVELILRGEKPIEPESQTGEKALALVRLHQSLSILERAIRVQEHFDDFWICKRGSDLPWPYAACECAVPTSCLRRWVQASDLTSTSLYWAP